jgi:hypothetical protein
MRRRRAQSELGSRANNNLLLPSHTSRLLLRCCYLESHFLLESWTAELNPGSKKYTQDIAAAAVAADGNQAATVPLLEGGEGAHWTGPSLAQEIWVTTWVHEAVAAITPTLTIVRRRIVRTPFGMGRSSNLPGCVR